MFAAHRKALEVYKEQVAQCVKAHPADAVAAEEYRTRKATYFISLLSADDVRWPTTMPVAGDARAEKTYTKRECEAAGGQFVGMDCGPECWMQACMFPGGGPRMEAHSNIPGDTPFIP